MQADVLRNVLTNEVSEARDEAVPAIAPSNNQLTSLARFAANSSIGLARDQFGSANRDRNVAGPKYLLSESVRKDDGVGPAVALDEYGSKLLVVTLDITNVVERTGLAVSVWGSPDQVEWGAKPLLTFRQRQYCGVYSVLLNLAMHTETRYLRVQWSMHRWGRTQRVPLFGFEVFVEESGARISSSALA
jgi:hypothetical protein